MPRMFLRTQKHDLSRWALCCLLVLSAGAKLLSRHQDSFVLPVPLYYGSALVECAIAVLLHTRQRRLALAAAIAIALAGITLAAAFPGRLCGCFGSLLPLDGVYHVLLSGAMGALACLGFGNGDLRAAGAPAGGGQ